MRRVDFRRPSIQFKYTLCAAIRQLFMYGFCLKLYIKCKRNWCYRMCCNYTNIIEFEVMLHIGGLICCWQNRWSPSYTQLFDVIFQITCISHHVMCVCCGWVCERCVYVVPNWFHFSISMDRVFSLYFLNVLHPIGCSSWRFSRSRPPFAVCVSVCVCAMAWLSIVISRSWTWVYYIKLNCFIYWYIIILGCTCM